ncbi:MAG: adenylate kinase [Candidatus Berkelbacteria bacterium Licking1014_96]|uniref:Adenylate kinase n=1 Tax=Candidatus Berkelbacteria bacterium Licking1014_96 TaxID=2017149 RepID=A0A554LHC7_9BACT|nr:MAG: adenylate kinase [Candidatus Berkelbacteria bacterium Licking1014_96]
MEKFLILIMGPQGSGKGTQGKFLAEKLGYVYAEMGPALKEYAQQDLEDEKIINQCQNEGKLVPDKIVMRAIKYKFEGAKSIIFDGVPRNKVQAKKIIGLASGYNFKVMAINIELEDSEALKRLLARRLCPIDGFEPPYPESLKKTKCDQCGATLIRRSDDKESVIKKRLKEYHQKTEPMMKYLSKKKITIINIDGRPSVPEISKNITQKLNELGIA